MKRFGKRLGVLLVAMALMLVSVFSVSAASVEEDHVAEDFANRPALSSAAIPKVARIRWYRNNGYNLNVYSSSSTPANLNNVTVYNAIPGDPLQLWRIDGDYNKTNVRLFVSGTDFCVDCSSNYNAQVYKSSGSGVNPDDQYLKMVDERQSTGRDFGCGFVLNKTISSTPRALWADESDHAGITVGHNVKFGVPNTSTQSAYYWYLEAI